MFGWFEACRPRHGMGIRRQGTGRGRCKGDKKGAGPAPHCPSHTVCKGEGSCATSGLRHSPVPCSSIAMLPGTACMRQGVAAATHSPAVSDPPAKYAMQSAVFEPAATCRLAPLTCAMACAVASSSLTLLLPPLALLPTPRAPPPRPVLGSAKRVVARFVAACVGRGLLVFQDKMEMRRVST